MLKGNNPKYQMIHGKSISPQSVSTITTVDGATIANPWRKARWIVFFLNFGAFAATASGRLFVQLQKKSDDTWVNALDNAGNPLEVLATKLDDAGALEGQAAFGSLRLNRFDAQTYKAMRVRWSNEVAVAALISVQHALVDLIKHPSVNVQTDELEALQA